MIQDVTYQLRISENYDEMYDNIQKELKQYLIENKLKSLVIGISGGIDSALCAALAKPVCDLLDIPLIGVSIPIQSNHKDEINRALGIGKLFCTQFHEMDLGFPFQQLSHTMNTFITDPLKKESEIEKKIRMGNIKARMRMIYLYNLAQFNKGMVLSTDNYTEYLLGFWTLHGDVGDYGMMQNLWKTEVYGLSKYIVNQLELEGKLAEAQALGACIDATPTDGLGITNSDLDQLGATSYTEVDQCLLRMFGFDEKINAEVCTKIIQRNKATEFKRKNPYNISRSNIIYGQL